MIAIGSRQRYGDLEMRGRPTAGSSGQGRLDAEKLDVLRAWGNGLAADERDEVRAAGRAITLLVEEIDRLYVELWHARDGSEPSDSDGDDIMRALRSRLPGWIASSRRRPGAHVGD